MKAKPIIIIFSILLLITVAALYVRSRTLQTPKTSEVAQFLKRFDKNLKAGNIDSLKSYLETNQHGKIVAKLLDILNGKKASDGKSNPLFSLALNADSAAITILNSEL